VLLIRAGSGLVSRLLKRLFFFAPKIDSIIRLCVDYRRLNKITIKNQYPLLLVSELFNRLSYIKIFIKLDLYNAYYRIRIKKGDKWKTVFKHATGTLST